MLNSSAKLAALSKLGAGALCLLASTLISADQVNLQMGDSAYALHYSSGGVYGRSLDRGFSLYSHDDEHYYASFNFRADIEAQQSSKNLLSLGVNIFAFQHDLQTNDPKDNLALGLAYYLALGYTFNAFSHPNSVFASMTYSPPGLANRSLARLYYYDLSWLAELNPEWSLSLGARRIDVYYSDVDGVDPSERFDNSMFVGVRYKF